MNAKIRNLLIEYHMYLNIFVNTYRIYVKSNYDEYLELRTQFSAANRKLCKVSFELDKLGFVAPSDLCVLIEIGLAI